MSSAALVVPSSVGTTEGLPTGLNLPDGMPFEDWYSLGRKLNKLAEGIMWWLGDWWCYGERQYGEAAAQAAPTGYAVATLQEAARVAERFELPRRLGSLSWSHHQVVAALDVADQDALLDKAEAEELSTRELRQEVRRLRTAIKVNGTRRPEAEDSPSTFATIVADPPWQYDNKATRGAAEDHYSTMTVEELHALPVAADDQAHLYLWTTNGFLREAFSVLDAWGFTYKTTLTWVKPQMGMGNYFRSSTEHVLFGTKGNLPTLANDVVNWFQAPRGQHSSKPDSFYDIVERSSPGPYLEMFARRRRLGWFSWGNEA